ncbi:MAG: epoxide hydrolase N-terminal domain-containing protein [Kocuria sp.]|nr:epoxide hydrolase N-terminal domain-containing protein [Kocuria sp.]MDO5367371.1 epoxide hydrolase N-terminal domain-containing protein [Kocuria sp.]
MTAPQPFTVEVPQRVLDGIREKVRAYEWPRTPSIAPDEDPWTYGTDPAWLRELCRYWTEQFDWRAAEPSSTASHSSPLRWTGRASTSCT